MPGTSGVTAEGPPNISHSAGRVPRRGPGARRAATDRRDLERIEQPAKHVAYTVGRQIALDEEPLVDLEGASK